MFLFHTEIQNHYRRGRRKRGAVLPLPERRSRVLGRNKYRAVRSDSYRGCRSALSDEQILAEKIALYHSSDFIFVLRNAFYRASRGNGIRPRILGVYLLRSRNLGFRCMHKLRKKPKNTASY